MISVFVEPRCGRADGCMGAGRGWEHATNVSRHLIQLGGISSITILKHQNNGNRKRNCSKPASQQSTLRSQNYQTQTQKTSTTDPRTSLKKLHNCMDNKHNSLVSLQLHSLRNSICNAFVSSISIGRPSIQRLNKTSQQFACVFVATLFHYCFIALLVLHCTQQ